ncbi:MAG: hypothetical protein HYT13_01080 [Candidatus Liptonbacteria bacterium]|nr:hypothetical protein [Candidatus Liptonbacteria bacterium]
MKGATKILLVFIIVVVVVLVGYALFQSQTEAPTINYGAPTTEPAATPPEPTPPTPPSTMPTPKTETVNYNGQGFSPQTVTIKKGDSVTFANQSSKEMWPASALHPTHKVYPTTGGCIGSTFDACAGIKPGESWSFALDINGSWKYHDHLNPTAFGTIVVE